MSQTFDVEEVKRHNDRNSIWIIIHGKVYDVTKFLDEHPGGEEVLLEHAGRDASDDFEDIGHSDDARGMLSTYLKGTVTGVVPTQDEEKVKKPSAVAYVKHEDPNKTPWILASVVGLVILGWLGLRYGFFLQK